MSDSPELRGALEVPDRADERMVRRILTRSGDRSARDWLVHLPDPDTADLLRLERSVMAAARQPRQRAPLMMPAGLALAAAAALLVALTWGGSGGEVAGSHPVAPASIPLDHSPLDRSVTSSGPEALALHQGISTVLEGRARFSGVASAPRVDLERGTLTVEVAPKMGFSYDVNTPEARVRVVGTRFQVERDSGGTRVTVERGAVEVTCTYGAPALLDGAGASGVCPALSGRDHRLAAHRAINSGAGEETALLAIEAGVAAATDPEELRLLLELRILVLDRAGRAAAARQAACDYGARYPDQPLPEGLDACE